MRSAKRKLTRLSGKERRFATDTNHHCLSQASPARAKDTNRAIGRAFGHSRAFLQSRFLVTGKARRTGVRVFPVGSRATNRADPDPARGHVEKANPRSHSRCTVRSVGPLAWLKPELTPGQNCSRAQSLAVRLGGGSLTLIRSYRANRREYPGNRLLASRSLPRVQQAHFQCRITSSRAISVGGTISGLCISLVMMSGSFSP